MDRRPRRSFRQQMLRWHYRLGLTAAFFMVLLAVTGILLNHNATWNFQHRIIESDWLRAWYDMPAMADKMSEMYPPLSLDRVLLDLHTGRFFGAYGPYVMDASAIMLILLTVTGIYNWSKRQKRK